MRFPQSAFHLVAITGPVLGCSPDGGQYEPVIGSNPSLTTREQTRYDNAFAAAACRCEAHLFGSTTGFSSATLDTELAALGRLCDTGGFQCASVADLSDVESVLVTECGVGPGTEQAHVTEVLESGLCRAEFNYCLFNELRLNTMSSLA